MNPYIISCCSTSDLSKEHYLSRNIRYICFHLKLGDKEYLDDLGESISISDFYSQLKEGVDSSTSQVNVYEYETYFRSFLDEGLDILHVTLSSGISGTLNSANIAAEALREEYPERKIYILDSLCASSGYGLLMDKAADLRDDGMTIDQLASWINDNKLKVNHWFFSTDLKHYIKGGRISKTAGLVAKALNICPLLRMNDTGHLVPVENIRTKKRVKQEIVKQMLTHAIDGLRYKDKCYISHSDCIEDAIDLAALIKNTFVNMTEKVLINDVGTVIGSHTGPGTVALFFWGKTRMC